jgi:hypothetical protein
MSENTSPVAPVQNVVLLPCPFCGSNPERHCSPRWKYTIQCPKCDIEFSHMSSEEVVYMWNKRPKIKFRPRDVDVERESSRTKATALAIIRERLAISSWERQRAVAEFPLVVAQVAHDMKRLMDELAYTEHTPKTVETLDYMESVIRDAYRSTFGRELGQ